VKCVHTGLCGRRIRLRFRLGSGLRARNIEKGQVLDGAGPGELRVIKGRIAPRGGWKVWPREKHERDMEQCCREDSTAGKAPLDAAIPKDKSEVNSLQQMSALERRGHITEETLVEATPGDFELRLNLTREEDVRRVEFRLTEEVVRIDVESRRHKV